MNSPAMNAAGHPSVAAQMILAFGTVAFTTDGTYPDQHRAVARRTLYHLVHTAMARGLSGGPALLSAIRRRHVTPEIEAAAHAACELLCESDLKTALALSETATKAKG